jgi:hypothetical protein
VRILLLRQLVVVRLSANKSRALNMKGVFASLNLAVETADANVTCVMYGLLCTH